ncbi:MAG TPA: methyltransferase domain-containing protein, partial [Rhizomicrobium sp.]
MTAEITPRTTHDEKIVAQFTRWAAPFSELALHAEADGMRRTLAAADLSPDLRVLDVACGPGIVTCAVAKQAGHVTGIDLTPAMIEQAKARQAREAIANCDWQQGDATVLPFADASFDRAITRYSFHHIPEPGRALKEMARVTKPGGRVVVIDATPTAETQGAYDAMETLRDPSHASALTLEQLRALGREAGLTETAFDFYRLDARLQTLADEADMAALNTLFDTDIASGEDRIGVEARRDADGIVFRFPVS